MTTLSSQLTALREDHAAGRIVNSDSALAAAIHQARALEAAIARLDEAREKLAATCNQYSGALRRTATLREAILCVQCSATVVSTTACPMRRRKGDLL